MEEKRKPKRWVLWLVVGLVLLVAYPLSIGPFRWCEVHGVISRPMFKAVRVVYVPVNWLIPHKSLMGKWLEWYINLWV